MMRLTAVIDRFEGDIAVLLLRKNAADTETPVILPKKFLPPAQEGAILKISLAIDKAATQNALAENAKLLQEILDSQE
ncbi:MAG: DUF3006 domain-containing protein [Sporomusaceae bacterium]|jgi:hypothetical protein|nr:DUF3006 domain-containing protein [Sporomusaceae bacterium]